MDPEELEDNVELIKELQQDNGVYIEIAEDGQYEQRHLSSTVGKLMDVSVLFPSGVRYVINVYNEEFQIYEMDTDTGEEQLIHQLPFPYPAL